MPDHDENVVEQLATQIRTCRICRDEPVGPRLPHEPNPVLQVSANARLCLAGQAPGLRVQESGIPFDDASGDRLRIWLGVEKDVFYDADKLAIVPMGFCFPGYDKRKSDLPPRPECVARWHDELFATMPQIELIVTIGQYAHAYHLGTRRSRSLTETVRNWRTYYETGNLPRHLPLPHPSWRNTGWLKKNPWFEEDVLPVLRREVKRLTGK